MAQIRDFKLPDLGEGLEEGEIVEWHVEVGDVIELNQTVADVETAKAVVAVPSPFAGRVVERIGEVGEPLEVGSVFLRVDVEGGAVAEGDDAPGPAAASDASPAQGGFEAGAAAADVAVPDADAEPGAAVVGERRSSGLDADHEPQPLVGYGQGQGRRRRRRGTAAGTAVAEPEGTEAHTTEAHTTEAPATEAAATEPAATKPLAKPPVRKLAKDLGIDLVVLAPGSGPDGVITRDDVHAAAEQARSVGTPTADVATAPAARADVGAGGIAGLGPGEKPVPGYRGRTPGEVEPIRGIRKRIVEKMETSRREIPEATCSMTADLTDLWELRKDLTEQARSDGFDVKVTPFALILRAVVLALRRFPTLNASIDREAGEIRLHEHINLGFAADTDRGLVVPNIKDAHTRSTLQLAMELNRLATAARDGSITAAELTGGTFSVSNYGAFGNDDGNAVINHPEGAILGVGAIRERPWVVQGELAVRRTCTFSLAFDHRISDGGEAGRFVTYVGALCERPGRILLHS